MGTAREHMMAVGVKISRNGDVRSDGQVRGEWSLDGVGRSVPLRIALPEGSRLIDGDLSATVEYRSEGPAKTMNAHVMYAGSPFVIIGSSVADVQSIAEMVIVLPGEVES